MRPDAITADTVRQALRAIRAARPLDDSPLLYLDAVTVRLGAERVADSPAARAAFLPRWLDELTREALMRMRGEDAAAIQPQISAERGLTKLKDDFQAKSMDREAWAIVQFHYFSGSSVTLRQLADELGLGYNTVRRRVERGYKLLVDVLRERERYASATVAHGHHVPQPLTRFIGREHEMASVRTLIAESPLVVLAGPGGIGKSRLAIELARNLAPDYSDGAWFVELAALEEGARVPRAVAAALGLREQPGRTLTDTLCDHLADKHLLLVLDNCEPVVTACSELVSTLLGRCQWLQTLATSREELHVAGQSIYSVPPMSVPADVEGESERTLMLYDALRLFRSRATEARSAFRITEDTARQVGRLCTTLEGIPLAIELAAPKLRYLTLDQLEERLEDRFRLLTDGTRALRPSHETLRATMDSSYDLLSEPERELLRRLEVFRGGWTLDAAEVVCSGDRIDQGDVIEILTQLDAKSLVNMRQAGGEPRFHMLETFRQYVRVRLEDEGQDSVWQDRHMVHFLALAERAGPELDGPDRETWQARLADDYENVRGALIRACEQVRVKESLSAAVAMYRWWEQQGLFGEGRSLLQRLLAWDAATSLTAERSAALRSAAELARLQGEYAAARQATEEALEISRSTGDTLGMARASRTLALVESAEGDPDSARVRHEESLALYRRLGRQADAATARKSLGMLAILQGEYDQAQQHLQSSLEVHRGVGNEREVVSILGALGVVAQYQSDYGDAQQIFGECLELARKLDDKYVIATALHNLGVTAQAVGNRDEARRRYEESLTLTREMGDKPGLVYTLMVLGTLAINRSELDAARAFLEESLAVAHEIGLATSIPMILANLGDVAIRQNHDESARQWLEEGLAVAARTGDKRSLALLHNNLGLVAARRGDEGGAHDHMSESLALTKGLGDTGAIAQGLRQCARIEAIRERPERALRFIGAAETLREQIGKALSPAGVDELAADVSQARTIMGEDATDHELANGRALTLDEAVGYALGEVTWDELADELAARMEAGEGEEAAD